MPFYVSVKKNKSTYYIANLVQDVRKGNPEEFMKRMETMFADNDYQIAGKAELYFQNAFCVIMKMMGFYTEVERTTSQGRIDMTIKTKDYIYVIEFKLDGTTEEALKLIEEKEYTKPFEMDSRKVYRIGVNFSSEKRCIEEWKIKE
jgi:ATP-dependent exoDNAse (exonuclease V) beta subunit